MLTPYSILRQLQAEREVVSKRRSFSANRSILSEGEPGQHLYLIEHGSVRVITRVKLKNHRHIRPGLRDLGPDEIFGELSLFDEMPQCVSVVTIEDTELLEFEVEPLLEYLDQHPAYGYVFMQQLLRLLSRRLIQADCRLKSLFAWGLEAQGIDQYL